MKVTSTAIRTLLLVAAAVAQTPADFTFVSTAPLLAYSNPSNITINPGILLPPSDVAYSPTIFLPTGSPSEGPYIGIQVDGTINAVHWIQPNLVAQPDGNLTVNSSIQEASQFACPYIEPEPQGDAPHNYVIMLFSQPSNWTVPSNYSSIDPPANVYARLNFSLPDFLSSSGLTSDLLGATYYRAMNGTAQQSSIQATATITGPGVPAEATATGTATSGSGGPSVSGSVPVASYTAGAVAVAARDSAQGIAVLAAGVLLLAL